MNHHIGTVIIAPISSKGRDYPTRVACTFQGIEGQIVVDQMRTVDRTRLVKKLGRLSPATSDKLLSVLTEMFQK